MVHLKTFQFHPLKCIIKYELLDKDKFLIIKLSIKIFMFYSKKVFMSYQAINVLKYLKAHKTI